MFRWWGRYKVPGYHIEKIIFESKPGRYVTAHLYMPENTTVPVPATLELCGHGLNGKGSSSHAAMLTGIQWHCCTGGRSHRAGRTVATY